MKNTLRFGMIGFLLAASAFAPPGARAQIRDLSWGTSAVGSSGHRALVNVAAVLNREWSGYRVAVLPTPGAIFTVKGYAKGDFGGYYGADIAFYELARDTARFKGFKAEMKRQPVQSFWTFTLEVGLAIHARDRDKIKQWRDLSGQRVFTGPLPWDVRAQLERALAALEVKHEYIEVDLGMVGSLLDAGRIKGFITYTTGQSSPPPWNIEAQLVTDLAVLNPSEEEVGMLRKAGLDVVEITPAVFKQRVYVDKLRFVPFFYGFHVGLEVPEGDVYRMLTIIEKHTEELVKADAGFKQLHAGMVELQRRGVASAVNDVPVHPGLAKYLRERGAWNPAWDNRIAK